MLTLRDIFEDALQLIDIESASLSALDTRAFVIRAINSGLQTLLLSGRDYFTKETETLYLSDGVAIYVLPQSVVNVIFPARLSDGAPIRELMNRGEADMFPQLYLGSSYAVTQRGKPMAAFVERKHVSGNDPTQATVIFAPTPNGAYTAEFSVSRTPPVYTLDQVSAPSPTVPVAHQFAESLLLPLVRWQMRVSRLFRANDMIPQLKADFDAAQEMLGLADPQVRRLGIPMDVLEQAKLNARNAARAAYQQTLAR